ncbi:unnamed protein product, partial [Allacma fusca]
MHSAIFVKKIATYAGANKCADVLIECDKIDSDWTEPELEQPTVRSRARKEFPGFELGYLNPNADSVDNNLIPSGSKHRASTEEQLGEGSADSVEKNSALPVQSQQIPLTPSCHIQVPDTLQLFPESHHTQQRSDQLEKIVSENRKFYKLVLTKLTSIEVDIASIKKIQFSSQKGLYELDEIPALPLREKHDLKTMDTWLKSAENCTKFRNYLHTIGGKSGEVALREILKK